MKRIIIAGTHSGCGKTTVTCAVLEALKRRCSNVSSFKCGPDYIDPMFHKKVLGIDSHNLDSFFCDDNTLKFLTNKYSGEISVIEGVMGYFDGIPERGSAYSLSGILSTGAIIVIDCKGASESIGAMIKGFLEYKKPNGVCGFIFNRLPERLKPRIEELCNSLGTEYLGMLPKLDFSFESRNLGLVTADEVGEITLKIKKLGDLAEKYIRLDRILEISECGSLNCEEINIPRMVEKPLRIAVAQDSAFSFAYSENLDILREMGCEIEFFSPIFDKNIPDKCCGIYICGGYPELYAKELSENKKMLFSLKKSIQSGIPIIAECGGFMYLHKRLRDADNREFDGVGTIDGETFETSSLKRFGYVELCADSDNLICKKSEKIKAHEFHYWDSTDCGNDFSAKKINGATWRCVHADPHCYAGFPHLYFYSDINIAINFVRECMKFGG